MQLVFKLVGSRSVVEMDFDGGESIASVKAPPMGWCWGWVAVVAS